MTPAARERLQVWAPMLLISAAAWILLAFGPSGMAMHDHHSAAMMTAASSVDMLLAQKPLAALAVSWLLMLAAMMLPLITAPVRHVRDRSFARRRAWAIALFAAGYVAIWMLAGAILLAVVMRIQLAARGSSVLLALAVVVAIIWQFSPVKQRCLNGCHAHAELAAFGMAADIDALRFGLTHGIWCVGSCWALMLLPLLVSRGHVAVMAAVTLVLFAERLDRPMPVRWSWRGPGKAARIAFVQVKDYCGGG